MTIIVWNTVECSHNTGITYISQRTTQVHIYHITHLASAVTHFQDVDLFRDLLGLHLVLSQSDHLDCEGMSVALMDSFIDHTEGTVYACIYRRREGRRER